MKLVQNVVVALVVLGLAASLYAANAAKKAEKKDTLTGVVVKVDGANVVVKARVAGEVKEITVATDAKTTVTIDGKESKVSALAEKMTIKVSPAKGTATKIEAKTPKAKEPKPAKK
jgi:hypothetical protein